MEKSVRYLTQINFGWQWAVKKSELCNSFVFVTLGIGNT
ncbi:hypothetical protein NSE_0037 [Neorickettsia sennetsu str. Miyayama]|uniref:Uncharacterized protein n=1 Tax=Ehrlichia sennetsu (strain ATCC VR-367 / Miyayama) TaxID=222891 RepID=Q2GF17_EHRS3|nr:hypothetical protein NSE_0037 [Neorickettsia sennetsu str. Miyayama]